MSSSTKFSDGAFQLDGGPGTTEADIEEESAADIEDVPETQRHEVLVSGGNSRFTEDPEPIEVMGQGQPSWFQQHWKVVVGILVTIAALVAFITWGLSHRNTAPILPYRPHKMKIPPQRRGSKVMREWAKIHNGKLDKHMWHLAHPWMPEETIDKAFDAAFPHGAVVTT